MYYWCVNMCATGEEGGACPVTCRARRDACARRDFTSARDQSTQHARLYSSIFPIPTTPSPSPSPNRPQSIRTFGPRLALGVYTMAHAGRRSTLASIDGNNQNGFASAIPVPSSAVKPVKTLGASTGLSMHPGAARQSMMPRASLAPGRAPGFAGGASASQGGLCPAGSQGMPRASILPQHYSQYDELGYPSSQVTTPHHLNASGRRGDAGIYGGRQSIAPVSAGRPSVAHATPR